MSKTARALSTLDGESYIDLVTFKKNGQRAHTPVWHVVADDSLYLFTQRESWKVRRMQRDPRIEVRACSMNGRAWGDTWTGTGRIVNDPAVEARVYDALVAKYGWQMRAIMMFATVSRRRSGWCVCRLVLE
jgi:PPOX class probable F420-dependent enzyme